MTILKKARTKKKYKENVVQKKNHDLKRLKALHLIFICRAFIGDSVSDPDVVTESSLLSLWCRGPNTCNIN